MKRFILPILLAVAVLAAWLAGRAGLGDEPTSPVPSRPADDAGAAGTIDADLERLARTGEQPPPASATAMGADERHAPLALDPALTFAMQQPALESAAQAGNASAAVALYHGWDLCGGMHALSESDRVATAERLVDFDRQFSEAIIADTPDAETRDAGIAALATIDPADAVTDLVEGSRAAERFCEGTVTLDWFDRRTATDRWLERAAVLGDPAAMRAFVFRAFQSGGEFTAVAAEMARRKPVVREVIARGLAAGDAYMLGEMAILLGRGYYGPADAERGYAYALAYLGALHLKRDPALGERFSASDLKARPWRAIEALRTELESGMDAASRERAIRLAPTLRSACCDGSRP